MKEQDIRYIIKFMIQSFNDVRTSPSLNSTRTNHFYEVSSEQLIPRQRFQVFQTSNIGAKDAAANVRDTMPPAVEVGFQEWPSDDGQ